jgi:hypothetical protein
MKHTVSISLIIISSFVVLLDSCKKDHPAPLTLTPFCQVSSVVQSDNTYAITYNTAGKPEKIVYQDEVRTFTYSGNTVTVLHKVDGDFRDRKIITLNSDGLPTNMRGHYNESGTEWYNEAFEYNGKEVIKRTGTDSYSSSSEVATYAWQNGNLISNSRPSFFTEQYEYYTDKDFKEGDHYYFEQFIEQSYQFIFNKNLFKSVKVNGNTTTYSYTFDADGKIASYKRDNGQPISFTYQCK